MASVNITKEELDGLDFMLGFVSLEAADFTDEEQLELDKKHTAALGFMCKSKRALVKESNRKLVKKMVKKAKEQGF